MECTKISFLKNSKKRYCEELGVDRKILGRHTTYGCGLCMSAGGDGLLRAVIYTVINLEVL